MPRSESLSLFAPQAALQPLFADPDWTYKLGLGGMLNASIVLMFALNPLFLPLSLALLAVTCGYQLKTISSQIRLKQALPEWGAYFELFMSGMNWLTIHFIWFFLQLSSLVTCFGLAYVLAQNKNAPAQVAGVLVLLFGILLWLLIDFLLGYCMLNFALQERFLAGFNLPRILNKINSNRRAYLLAWLLSIGIRWAGVLLPIITVVGIFMMPSTIFAAQILSISLLAQVWGKEPTT